MKASSKKTPRPMAKKAKRIEPRDQLEAMEQHSLIIPPHPEMFKLPQEPCAGGVHMDITVQGGKYVCSNCGVTVR